MILAALIFMTSQHLIVAPNEMVSRRCCRRRRSRFIRSASCVRRRTSRHASTHRAQTINEQSVDSLLVFVHQTSLHITSATATNIRHGPTHSKPGHHRRQPATTAAKVANRNWGADAAGADESVAVGRPLAASFSHGLSMVDELYWKRRAANIEFRSWAVPRSLRTQLPMTTSRRHRSRFSRIRGRVCVCVC
jgi:hypothetical protein